MLTKPLCTNGIRLKEIKASSVGTISRKKQHNLAKHERKTSQRNSNSLLMICICVCLCHCDFYSLWNLLNTHIQPVLTIISVIIITADGITTIYTFQLFFSPSLHRSFISHITFLACKHTHTQQTQIILLLMIIAFVFLCTYYYIFFSSSRNLFIFICTFSHLNIPLFIVSAVFALFLGFRTLIRCVFCEKSWWKLRKFHILLVNERENTFRAFFPLFEYVN